jgi:hypothetical protein
MAIDPEALPTTTAMPTAAITITDVPQTAETPPPAGQRLIVTGLIIIRNENGEQIGRASQGEYPLLETTSTAYIIEFEGGVGYINRIPVNIHITIVGE